MRFCEHESGFIFSPMRYGYSMHLCTYALTLTHFRYALTISYAHIASDSKQIHYRLSREWWIMRLTGRENNSKHMIALLMDTFNNSCDAACLKFKFLCDKNYWLFKIHPLSWGSNDNSIMRSAFHKVHR